MNTFTLLTAVGAFGVVVSFFSGVCPRAGGSNNMNLRDRASNAKQQIFGMAVGLTILAAPLAG